MIREFKFDDTNMLMQSIDSGDIIDENYDLIGIENGDNKLFVYDDSEIKGFVCLEVRDEETKKWNIELYVKPQERRKGIGTALYNKANNYLKEKYPNQLITEFRVDSDDPTNFFKKLGYKKWYAYHEMHYKGGFQPHTDIEFLPYEDKYYEQYAKCRQDCFYELRKENDIQPYIYFQLGEQDRENNLKRRDNIYIALKDGQIIASFDLKEGYLDRIIVPPTHQGKGFGKQATKFAINKALSQNAKLIHLTVLDWNIKAMNLYKSLGFEIVETINVYRQFGDR